MRSSRWLLLSAGLLGVCLAGAADLWLHADETPTPAEKPGKLEFKKPANWPENHPLPQVASNCATCHLTAGRELTEAAVFFAHSVHDLNQMSCFDCHGGNTEDNALAHEDRFGFIGTKLSAHIKKCGECHEAEAEALAAGPHHWDFSTRINTKYPTCIDCHGNHDIGNAPADFKLADVCADCHRDAEKKFPHIASVVEQNDLFWETVGKLRDEKLGETDRRFPEGFDEEIAALRADTMQAIHASKELTPEQAESLNSRSAELRRKLENWLKQAS